MKRRDEIEREVKRQRVFGNRKCPNCESKEIIRKGRRKEKFEIVQKYQCKECGENFSSKKLENSSFSPRVIISAISSYDKGLNEGEKDLEKDLENLTTNQRAILREIRENPRITQEKLSKAININEKNIRNNIAKLRQQGLLKRVGPAKGGHWEIIKGSDNINDEKEVGNE